MILILLLKGETMRMWMIEPEYLCRQHLLGEHNEIHKHRHNFEKKHSISGRIHPVVLIEPANMKVRHDQLVKEMLKRGYNHSSPYSLPDLCHLPKEQRDAKCNISHNIKDLCSRCQECEKLIKNKLTFI